MASRRTGRAGIIAEQKKRESLRTAGEALHKEQAALMQVQLKSFSDELEKFAFQHKQDIQQDPLFRAKFHEMCNKLGVDPLTSQKGIWAKMLGLGDFYYELGVRIIEICVRTKKYNGGFIALPVLLATLRKRRTVEQNEISEDDVERAVKKLGILGSGFKIVEIGEIRLIRSVPVELSVDHTTALRLCRTTGRLTRVQMKKELGWVDKRIESTLQYLLDNELAWLDLQAGSAPVYWILGLVPSAGQE